MARKIIMKNEMGQQREVKEGFSFTVFFFSFIALAVRKQYKFAIVALVINITLGFILMIPGLPNLSFLSIIIAIIYGEQANKRLKDQLLAEGYKEVNTL